MTAEVQNFIDELTSKNQSSFTKQEIIAMVNEHFVLNKLVSIESNGVILNPETHTIHVNGIECILPNKEYRLLYFMMQNKNRCISRTTILSKVWGNDTDITERTVDVHLAKIRKVVGKECIHSFKGQGYAWVEKRK
jgi:DNA-binding response OmpR family regulator